MSREDEIKAEIQALEEQSDELAARRKILRDELVLLLTPLRVGDLCDLHTFGKKYSVVISRVQMNRYGYDRPEVFFRKVKKDRTLHVHEQQIYSMDAANEKLVKIGRYRPPPRVRGAAPAEED